MKRILTVLLLVVVAVLASCTQGKKRAKGDVMGTWTLVRMAYPGDELVREYPSEDISWLRIYDDSCYYECEVVNASTGTMFIPSKTGTYNLIETGKDQFLYMQEDGRHPFVIEDDSTIMIQVAGIKYTWKMCDDYDEEKTGAISVLSRMMWRMVVRLLADMCSRMQRNISRRSTTYSSTLQYSWHLLFF